MKLRDYQVEAVNATYDHLYAQDTNPCVVIPTGGGKSVVIAQICHDATEVWNGRVLILAHVKELLQQIEDKLTQYLSPFKVGVFSAGLSRKEAERPVVIAGIQSAHRSLERLGSFNLVLVDEAHLLPPEGEGMYRTLFDHLYKLNPTLRVVGFTATPYRMKSGSLVGPDNILNTICYEAGIRDLVSRGYLCPLRSKAGLEKADLSNLRRRAGEFVAKDAAEAMSVPLVVQSACAEIVGYMKDRHACLIFASSKEHAQVVQSLMQDVHGEPCGIVLSGMSKDERAETLAQFQRGDIRFIVNVNILTTGFDAPHIDCIAMLRPTLSPGLYSQMLGRGFRLHPDKQDCLVLDFAENIMRHGPVDALQIRDKKRASSQPAPAKECPKCREVIAAGFSICPSCGYPFPLPEREAHDATASTESPLTPETTRATHTVQAVTYSVHTKRNASAQDPQTMRVEYQVGANEYISEWVCIEHSGYARKKAKIWWEMRSLAPFPQSSEDAVAMARDGFLAQPISVTILEKAEEPFPKITGFDLGPVPAYREPGFDDAEPATSLADIFSPDEIPF